MPYPTGISQAFEPTTPLDIFWKHVLKFVSSTFLYRLLSIVASCVCYQIAISFQKLPCDLPAANDNSDQPCACNNPNFVELTLLCWLSDLGLGLGFMLNQIYLASLPGTIPYFSTRHHSALIFCCQNSTLQIEHHLHNRCL